MRNLQTLRSKVAAATLGLAVSVMASPAMAAIDVASVVTDIEGTKAPIGLIGVAVLGVIVAIAAFGYVRRAIRG